MKIAIMQPYIFPYIGYWQLINAVDTFILLDDVTYIKKGWINRNNILLNNKAHTFTLPLQNASQNKLINQISLFEEQKWKEKFLKTIKLAYKKAPYFNDVFSLIEQIILNPENNLSAFAFNSIKVIAEHLGLSTRFIETSDIYKNINLKGQNRIIDICLKQGAKTYINPIGGIKLYNKNSFLENNICLKFLKSNENTYRQFKEPFIPNLSIVDILMFNNPTDLKTQLNDFQLV